ncbi:VOC family protein [Modestobacter roseus]|nr:VOC family protein [Modestobacter roseus]
MLFVNLPVRDLGVSREFYTALGLRVHEQFSDERTLAVVLSDEVALMLQLAEHLAERVPGPLGEPTTGVTAVLCLTVDSRERVDELVTAAVAAGGRRGLDTRSDGLRYVGSFTDPDGHAWEAMLMGQTHVVN